MSAVLLLPSLRLFRAWTPVKACQLPTRWQESATMESEAMEILIVMVAAALFLLYAIGRSSGEADEQADEMMAALRQEQADAEAWGRITK